MIKTEKSKKIPKNPKFTLKTLKNCRRASLSVGGGHASPDRGDFSDFSMTGGILG